jgi:hypothetical protein
VGISPVPYGIVQLAIPTTDGTKYAVGARYGDHRYYFREFGCR